MIVEQGMTVRCPRCKQILFEVVGDRVVINKRNGPTHYTLERDVVTAVCPELNCGHIFVFRLNNLTPGN